MMRRPKRAQEEEVEKEEEEIDWHTRGSFSRHVGEYVLEGGALGEGASGCVEACKRQDGKQCAVKVFEKAVLRRRWDLRPNCRRSALDKAYEELAITRKLRHPFVVSLLEVIEDDTHIFMFMELCVGPVMRFDEDERQFACAITGGACGAARAARYVDETARALLYIHGCGIAHRDVKPANILLSREGHCRLCDFGEAGDRDSTCTVGTVAYWPPENFDKKGGAVDAFACDVWALGCCLYNFFTRNLPFDISDAPEDLSDRTPINAAVPSVGDPAVDRLLNAILQKAPTKRAALAEIVEDAWVRNTSSLAEQHTQEHTSHRRRPRVLRRIRSAMMLPRAKTAVFALRRASAP
ncbi:hypothetical protein CTAYLR_004822 [Chrysophaeum taylorii]|uniref:Protein kinase domain-containing protein n=1 Tax=Chrysophaeum taylorii TaxID=2483200 RepID=A0AAD7UMT9_9STRA|nr:hypothetical protein CTAYLR_004822 [Chrysophaeum taylorii]